MIGKGNSGKLVSLNAGDYPAPVTDAQFTLKEMHRRLDACAAKHHMYPGRFNGRPVMKPKNKP